MTKEQIYKAQLTELGIWEDAFAPEVATLAQLERELTRAKKAWSATAPAGGKPDMLDPLYAVIIGIRKEILAHRETLGLTPKALRKLRGAPPPGPTEQDLITERLGAIAARVGAYDDGPLGIEVPERMMLAAGEGVPAETETQELERFREYAEGESYAGALLREWNELGGELGVQADE